MSNINDLSIEYPINSATVSQLVDFCEDEHTTAGLAITGCGVYEILERAIKLSLISNLNPFEAVTLINRVLLKEYKEANRS